MKMQIYSLDQPDGRLSDGSVDQNSSAHVRSAPQSHLINSCRCCRLYLDDSQGANLEVAQEGGNCWTYNAVIII